jgi:uncharacterized protein
MVSKNTLSFSHSPYLLQHKDNPVYWQEWSDEAFAQAKKENKPVFVSVGYASCHWCHVMAHESFEDLGTAKILNKDFICIKVDRQMRPDVDNFLMSYVQSTTGHGGWPMSVFLTHEKKPFFGGTYFPKEPKYGLPSFTQLLKSIVQVYHKGVSPEHFAKHTIPYEQSNGNPSNMLASLQRSFDAVHAGFGHHTKFPPWNPLFFLLRYFQRTKDKTALSLVTQTLDTMATYGLHDHLGGGFHRYCVDREWSIPHFEKMLYDQALTIWAYSEAYAITKKSAYKEIVAQTVQYLRRECLLTNGYVAALDADSERREGEYYLWSAQELKEMSAQEYFILPKEAHMEGKYVLHAKKKLTKAMRNKMLSFRQKRKAPEIDNQVLTCWNAMLGHALCIAGRYVDEQYLSLAQDLHQRLSAHVQEDSLANVITISRYSFDSACGQMGYLEDHSWFGLFSLSLYEATGIEKYLNYAKLMHTTITSLFWQKDLQDTCVRHEQLGETHAETVDHPVPSSTSVTLYFFSRMGRFTGQYPLKAEDLLKRLNMFSMQSPEHYGFLALVCEESLHPMIKGAISLPQYIPTYLRDPASDPLQLCIGVECRRFPSRQDIMQEIEALFEQGTKL